jgi:Raf kinase inhibitor-like YbhB/YbcL family protein
MRSTALLTIFALLVVASPMTSAAKENTNAAKEKAVSAKYELVSPEFKSGGALPKSASCDGESKSPALEWKTSATDAKSFALIVDDPDAPKGTFTHWVLFDVPAATRTLPQAASGIGISGRNDFDKNGYGPACPPKGHGVHHYHFKLYALDVEKLGLAAGVERKKVEAAMNGHVIGQGELIGTYERR